MRILKGIFRFLARKIIALELAHSLMAYFIIFLAFGPKLPARHRIPAFKWESFCPGRWRCISWPFNRIEEAPWYGRLFNCVCVYGCPHGINPREKKKDLQVLSRVKRDEWWVNQRTIYPSTYRYTSSVLHWSLYHTTKLIHLHPIFSLKKTYLTCLETCRVFNRVSPPLLHLHPETPHHPHLQCHLS